MERVAALPFEAKFNCHICGSADVAERAAYRKLPGVTSDSRPWPAGTAIGVCRDCGIAVKMLDAAWHANVAEIYRSYAIYHQSNGVEKLRFDHGPDRATPRSAALLDKLFTMADVPAGGRVLDVGTGTGVLLRAMSQRRPDLELWAQDLSDQQLPVLSRIPNFRGLHSGDIATVPGQYDLISLIHVLEHVPNPQAFLRTLRSRLAGGGIIVINIPDASENPFDILVVDHCSHFSLDHLSAIVAAAGFELILSDDGILARELVVVARAAKLTRYVRPEHDSVDLDRYIAWLDAVLAKAAQVAANNAMAIFGASNAGAWLGAALKDWKGSFVDEDASRIGNKLVGHDIIAPADVPAGTPVFVPFADRAAERIAARLSDRRTRYIVPDSMAV
jgi:2-polyprenyl-3-methyl-5-hydroxy-6-metoxy-1,4-benzoquinol methylase